MLAAVNKQKKLQRRKRIVKVLVWTSVGLLSYELFVALVLRRQKRRDAYNAAVSRANATQKSLIVVGSPHSGFIPNVLGKDHDCGELCVDERGCPKCPTQAVATLDKILPTLPANSAVIFVSDTLEDVSNMPSVMQELQRVSGGDLFVSHRMPWTLTAFLSPGAKRRVLSAPPDTQTVTWKALPWRQSDVSTSFKLTQTTAPRQALKLGAFA